MTRDTNTGQLVECVRKVRLGDLNVYCPKREADWRVSVNLEIPSEFWGLLFFLFVSFLFLRPGLANDFNSLSH